jgi:hypothetical protein
MAMNDHRTELELEVLPQPDDVTCGPTCLHAVYRYWEHDVSLDSVISAVQPLPEGGTLAVDLACHALREGFSATIYTYNLQIFDPTWFTGDVDIAEQLRLQRKAKRDVKLSIATDSYLEFLELGGKLRYQELAGTLLRRYLKRGIPILTGLSATYLYSCAREIDDDYDDVLGVPSGHFVILSGYDRARREVTIADPLQDNPGYGSHYYRVGMNRLVAAILLGILTYDANLLIVAPRKADKVR